MKHRTHDQRDGASRRLAGVQLLIGLVLLGSLHLVDTALRAGRLLAAGSARLGSHLATARARRHEEAARSEPADEPSGSTERSLFKLALGGTVAAIAGVAVALGGVAGSYAFLNASASIGSSGMAITAGTLSITVNGGTTAAIGTTQLKTMLPGDTVAQTVTIADTGAAKAVITASTTLASPFTQTVSVGACASTQPSSPSGTALGTTASAALATVAVGGSQQFCLQTTLPSSAPASTAGTSSAFTVTFNGTQSST